jgi:WD40 repeat protein
VAVPTRSVESTGLGLPERRATPANTAIFAAGAELPTEGGSDVLSGSADNDKLTGGTGDDQVVRDSGSSQMIGNPCERCFVLAGSSSGRSTPFPNAGGHLLMSETWFDPHDVTSDRVGAWVRSAKRRSPRVQVPIGGSIIVLVALAIAVYYDVGPTSIAPARRTLLQKGDGAIRAIAFKPGGGLLAASKGGTTVTIWKLDGFGHAHRHFIAIEGTAVALTPEGSVLAIGGESKVTLWDTDLDARRLEIPTRTGTSAALAFSRDGKMLAVAGDRSLTIRDASSGQELAGAAPMLPGVTSVAFSPDGHALATGDNGGQVRIWDLTTGQERATARAHDTRVTCLDFSNDGGRLVSASFFDRVPRIWDGTTCRPVASLRGHSTPVQTAALSWDGRIVATAAMDGDLRLWHVDTGQQVATLHGNDAVVLATTFSPDGRTLGAGGVGQTVWMWDAAP